MSIAWPVASETDEDIFAMVVAPIVRRIAAADSDVGAGPGVNHSPAMSAYAAAMSSYSSRITVMARTAEVDMDARTTAFAFAIASAIYSAMVSIIFFMISLTTVTLSSDVISSMILAADIVMTTVAVSAGD